MVYGLRERVRGFAYASILAGTLLTLVEAALGGDLLAEVWPYTVGPILLGIGLWIAVRQRPDASPPTSD